MKNSSWTLVFMAWLVATLSTVGALFMSEIMGFAPCVLCWYQRIFMFPLVFVLGMGLFPFDPKVIRYALGLSLVGLSIAVFHSLLMAGVIPESLAPCRQGIPCTTVQIQWFGFVTIPMLSATAFLAINVLLVTTYFRTQK